MDLERNGGLCMEIKLDDMVVTSIIMTKIEEQKLREQAAKLGTCVSELIRMVVLEWLEARADRA